MNISKWVPTVVTTLLAIVGANSAAVDSFVQQHPSVAIILAGIYALVKGLLPSPVTPAPKV